MCLLFRQARIVAQPGRCDPQAAVDEIAIMGRNPSKQHAFLGRAEFKVLWIARPHVLSAARGSGAMTTEE
jgi:hypothetical protein